MIEVTHSSDGHLWLDTPAMATGEYEGGFLLPQLMGALASESMATPVPHRSGTYQNKDWVLKLGSVILQALKIRFFPL